MVGLDGDNKKVKLRFRRTVMVILIIIILFIIGTLIVGNYFYNYALTRDGVEKNMSKLENSEGMPDFDEFKKTLDPKWWDKHNAERISIESFDGLNLSALYVKNEVETNKIVIFSHGYSASATSMVLYAPTYYDLGYDVISVDNRSHGKSEGDIIGMGYFESKDMLSWINKAIEIKGDDCEIVLHGVSMGASTMCSVSNKDIEKNVKCIISDCAYDNAEEVYTHLLKSEYNLPKFPIINALELICKVRGNYLLSDADITNSVANSKVPILFIHGSEDTFVPVYMAKNLYNATPKDKRELYIVNGASHAASIMINKDEYIEKITDWIVKYVK